MLIIVELIKLLFTISEGMNNLFILRIVDFSLSSGRTKEVYRLYFQVILIFLSIDLILKINHA